MKINELLDEKITTNSVIKVNRREIKVKAHITAADCISYVNTIADSVFNSDGNYDGAYEIIVTAYANVKFLTDIEFGDLEAAQLYDLTGQEWYRKVLKELEGTDYYGELQTAVARTIKARTKTGFDKLCDSLGEAVEKFSAATTTDALESLKELASKLSTADNEDLVQAIAKHAKATADEVK